MFEMLKAQGLSNKIVCPLTGLVLHLIGFAYVDDTDLFAISEDDDVSATIQKMQEMVNAWERASKVTGGALEPVKSWWYLVHFVWNKGLWRYGHIDDMLDVKITTLDKENKLHTLTRLEPDQAEEMTVIMMHK